MPLECEHRGDELTGYQRVRLELDHVRRWTWCNHPAKPLGKAVCSCMGCGTGCPGYTVGSEQLAELKHFAANIPDYPGGDGCGIVTVGGGKYWPGIALMCRLARRLGITLPIEIWHRGTEEPVYPEQLRDLPDITYHDTTETATNRDAWQSGNNPKSAGWVNKLHAMTHTRFETILFLDADAYSVSDPAVLLAMADRYGFVYWQDLPVQEKSVKWPHVWPQGPGKTRPIQGGQMAINRRDWWRELSLSYWMCQRADYYFQHMFGDQDTMRVASAITGRTGHLVGRADWQRIAFVYRLGSCPLIVHRCQAKFFPGQVLKTNPELPREAEALEIVRRLL